MTRVATASIPGNSVSVGASSVEILPASDRIYATICNDHATQVLYLSLGGTAVVNKGIRINAAGGSYTLYRYSGAVSAIATGASTTATITEY